MCGFHFVIFQPKKGLDKANLAKKKKKTTVESELWLYWGFTIIPSLHLCKDGFTFVYM